jgi:phosphate starvation-inducible PhoH-like protein
LSERTSQRVGIEGVDPLCLYGHNDANLVAFEKRYGVNLFARGQSIVVEGDPDRVERACRTLQDIVGHIRRGGEIDLSYVLRSGRDLVEEVTAVTDPARVLLSTRKSQIRPRSPGQQRYVDAIDRRDIVFCIGPAGTGKTYLAVAAAVAALKRREVSHIILTRPAVEAGESLGFLPGDIQEKVDPYLRPLYDALQDMVPPERMRQLGDNRALEIVPLAFMRGRTLNNAFVILDEAQNTTVSQMKMFLTRLGANAKAVVTGDITQVDLPPTVPSGLVQIPGILSGVEGIEFVYLTERDVVRHPLVQQIIKAYEVYEKASEPRPADEDPHDNGPLP